MKLSPTRHDEVIIEKAKEMYMNFSPITNIAKALNIPRTTIQNYVMKSWKQERIIFSGELLSEIANNKKAMLTQIAGKSIDLIVKSLDDLSKKSTLSAFEANTLANIFEKLDRILKLDAGDPTEIIANTKPATVLEIQERLKLDPFLIEEADILEEEENEEDTDDSELNINTVRDAYERKGSEES